jgi:hypothetical protein
MTGRNTKHRCKQLRKLHQATLDPTIPGYTGTEAEGSHREAVNNMIGLLYRCMEYSNSSDVCLKRKFSSTPKLLPKPECWSSTPKPNYFLTTTGRK